MNAILGIETAARLCGYSVRHFRRLVEEDGLRVIQIGRKFFIVSNDLLFWAKKRNLQIKALQPQVMDPAGNQG
jgi:excisionase family DNA binding protein